MIDYDLIYNLAVAHLSAHELRSIAQDAYSAAQSRQVSHRTILPSMLLAALQELGVDCSSAILNPLPV